MEPLRALLAAGQARDAATVCYLSLQPPAENAAAWAKQQGIALISGKDLGCQLFTREHKGMRLTEEGHAMLEHAHGVFAAIDGMEAEAALLGSSLQGKATLAANSSSLHGFIGPHIGEFLTDRKSVV